MGLVCCWAERFVGEALGEHMGLWQMYQKAWHLEAGDGESMLPWSRSPGPMRPAGDAEEDRAAGFSGSRGLQGPGDSLWDEGQGRLQGDSQVS